jgi:isoleucyl-tRNA synthetase
MAFRRDEEQVKRLQEELLAPSTHFKFSAMEENVLAYWKSIDAFQTSLKLSEGRPLYTFYDGPPFATGRPHYGHILAGTIKDTVTRYAHQTGHYVTRRFGWDCHGLPVRSSAAVGGLIAPTSCRTSSTIQPQQRL